MPFVVSRDTPLGTINHSVTLSTVTGAAFQPGKTTWLVIHGLDSSPTADTISTLVNAVSAARSGDQVMTLDWSSAATGNLNGEGENWIIPVAEKTATVLKNLGFAGSSLNLIGHSWGSYVAAGIAKNMAGGVNTIVALDPAKHYPFGIGYNAEVPGEVNFSANSQYSWAFHDGDGIPVLGWPFKDAVGSNTTPETADESFVVLGTNHSGVANVFSHMLTTDTFAAQQYFSLNRVISHSAGPWSFDQFDAGGSLATGGKYEAVLSANADFAKSISFVPLSPSTLPANNQVVSLRSYNYPDYVIRHRNSEAFIDPNDNSELFRLDSSFRVRPGLADPSAVSFESVNYPGYYLRHSNWRLILSPNDGSDLFRKDATFFARPGLRDGTGFSFESFNYPGYFLRHSNYEIWLAAPNGSTLFKEDATFLPIA